MFASKDTLLTRPSGGYTIARSVRFRSSATAYFNRTPASSGSTTTWTFSAWVKLGTIGVARCLFSCGANTSNVTSIDLRADHRIQLYTSTAGGQVASLVWNPNVYRDPSAWYHFVIVADTTNATSTNRYKFYVNNVQVTGISTTPGEDNFGAQNAATNVNSTVAHSLGRKQASANEYFDGYVTEAQLIDGQALTPSSFGSTNAITGVWQPAKYAGTYGTNGFYLNFSDNSNNTATTIGKDYSGNGNNWTPNNISVTAGATYDSMVDSPTVGATSSNYCVLNPLITDPSYPPSSGNLINAVLNNQRANVSTIALPSTGTYVCEMSPYTSSVDICMGICLATTRTQGSTSTVAAGAVGDYLYYQANGNKISSAGSASYGSALAVGDILGIVVDTGAGTITFYKNGTSLGQAYSGLSGTFVFCAVGATAGTNSSVSANFGQRPFSYTYGSAVALNTYNLPASTITNGAAYMAATTYTGNGSTQSISNAVNGVSFQPDWLWVKERSEARSNLVWDSVRGSNLGLITNTTSAESAQPSFTGFLSNGFGVSNTDSSDITNKTAQTYVGWQWKAGGTAVTNTNGSITSTVSAGATQGFSVVTYTGLSSGVSTIGHGLGVAPSMIIVKSRTSADNWFVYHVSTGNTGKLNLNDTSAFGTVAIWNNTSPTSTVFTFNNSTVGSAQNYVAYCFAAVAGYSAFG
jgi:hypothetical protein